jgi:DNA polymerase/3'-5' exonuclease PolX
MSGGAKRPLAEGLAAAQELARMLRHTTQRLEVAGSIRRGKAEVGDIDLVALALPGDPLSALIDELERGGVVSKGLNKNGDPISWSGRPCRHKALVWGEWTVNVFIVQPDRQWGPTLLIRTGPGEGNEALVTASGQRSPNGVAGVMPPGMRWLDGAIWRETADGWVKLDTAEEVDVYAALDLPWLRPDLRTAAEYQRWARARAHRPAALRGARAYVGATVAEMVQMDRMRGVQWAKPEIVRQERLL